MSHQLLEYPFVVIGAGAAGLVIAIGASKLGKKVLLIEKSHYGGDCTHFGCIPSKTLIESAKSANCLKPEMLKKMGLQGFLEQKDFNQVFSHVQNTIQHFESEENPQALHAKGVDTLSGVASFLNENTLSVLDQEKKLTHIKFQKAFICTGSKPCLPALPGLHNIKFHTNESIFSLKSLPKHLGVIGGGPIACELGQAFSRLGSRVSLFEKENYLMPNWDRSLSKILHNIFLKEGIEVHLGTHVSRLEKQKNHLQIHTQSDQGSQQHSITDLLIATGREANYETLNLTAAGIQYSSKGIRINDYGQSSQAHIFALGDVSPLPKFTHYAEHEARTILYNTFMPSFAWKKLCPPQRLITLFCEPEWAEVGVDEKQALMYYKPHQIKVYEMDLIHNDRAITALKTDGRIKVLTKKWSGRILGAAILAPHAGEMIAIFSLAIQQKLSLRHLNSLLYPYPSYSRIIQQLSDKYYTEHWFPQIKKWKKYLKL